MPASAEQAPSRPYPLAPKTLEDAGLSFEFVTELALKTLHRAAGLSGAELARRLGLNFTVIEPSLDVLKLQHQCEITGGPLGGSSFRYRLTEAGHAGATAALERNQYVGAAPVPIDQYRRYMEDFQRSAQRTVTADQVAAAFSHLVVSDRVLNEIGPAVNAGQAIFIYGPPGNGKTVMARAIRDLLPGAIAIPYALLAADSIIQFFDPAVHEVIPWPHVDEDAELRFDRRWALCRRPMVAVGGELAIDALSLAYNSRSGIYHAPVQALANGGVLLIDDFGRQRSSPRDLLNWWMVPLESRVESLPLASGGKVEMPFLPLVIFSTNLKPSELVDEAFLRRIQYKIYAENPSVESFIKIFERCCQERDIPFDRRLVVDMIDRFMRPYGIELRACQPRDLIDQALSLASYRGLPRRLSPGLLQAACLNYFIEARQSHVDEA